MPVTDSHNKYLLSIFHVEGLLGAGTDHSPVVLCRHLLQGELSVDVPVGQHQGVVVLVEGLARYVAHQPGLRAVRVRQGLGQGVEGRAADWTVGVPLPLRLVADGGLEGRQAGLQRDGEHRDAAQLVELEVVVAELEDQLVPARLVEVVLVGQQLGAEGEGQQPHDVLDVLEVVLLQAGGKVLPGVPDRLDAEVLADQLDELLLAEVELQGALQLPKFGLVVVAPVEAAGGLVSLEGLLHLLRDEEQVDVGQVLDVRVLGQLQGGVVVAAPQEVVHQHPVQPLLLPLDHRRLLGAGVLLQVVQPPLADGGSLQFFTDAPLRLAADELPFQDV